VNGENDENLLVKSKQTGLQDSTTESERPLSINYNVDLEEIDGDDLI
jgi:hypothetical protein